MNMHGALTRGHLKLSKLPIDGISGPPMRLQNLGQVVERALTSCYQRLRNLSTLETNSLAKQPAERLAYVIRDYSQNELKARQNSREKRLVYYQKIQHLQQAG